MRRREFMAGLGSAAAWPLTARAQQPAIPVMGYLAYGQKPTSPGNPFLEGLAQAGYVPGRNLAIEFRGANFQNSILPRLAADLVARKVAVIVTIGSASAAVAAKAATSTTPIVFMLDEDPIEYGLVASFNRPGGNVTGVTFLTAELAAKRLNLLLEFPQATAVGYLCPPSDAPIVQARISDILAAGRALGREIIVLEVRRLDFEAAFRTLVEQRVGALIVGNYTLFAAVPSNRNKILELAARYKVPTIYTDRRYSVNGGLMSYGTSGTEQDRNAGLYTGRVLKGEKPADLPVIQPTKFELVINLTTAKAMGIEVPETLLATADDLIEPHWVPTLGWNLVPTITVVSAAGDPRLPLVRDAVAFWNDTFAELGTQFRLGALTQVAGQMPVEDLRRREPPESLKRIESNIVVALSEGEFISFNSRWAALDKVVVAIKDYRSFPLTLPNVARNLIAHQLGLAIGLSHNTDPTTLMCGRPASCRPDIFASDSPKYFPLTDDEKRQLLTMYPPQWKPQLR
jgi:putative tryptophan/tyrosine transport system substrate-binding protein